MHSSRQGAPHRAKLVPYPSARCARALPPTGGAAVHGPGSGPFRPGTAARAASRLPSHGAATLAAAARPAAAAEAASGPLGRPHPGLRGAPQSHGRGLGLHGPGKWRAFLSPLHSRCLLQGTPGSARKRGVLGSSLHPGSLMSEPQPRACWPLPAS